jgi:hypothetical protein
MKKAHILIGKSRIGVIGSDGSTSELSDAKTRSKAEKLVAQRQELGRKLTKLLIENGVNIAEDDEPTEEINR